MNQDMTGGAPRDTISARATHKRGYGIDLRRPNGASLASSIVGRVYNRRVGNDQRDLAGSRTEHRATLMTPRIFAPIGFQHSF
jgi:hypothetical protein